MLSRVRAWMQRRLERKLWVDQLAFGHSVVLQTPRHRWNPLRFILGEIKVRRIDPRKMSKVVKL